ncbi:hypothetical protein JXA85_05395 [Candidatus Woesearchaeota archaeon]|nr:hypothetical protein [Candidatus Woesearchaeota archaeon]
MRVSKDFINRERLLSSMLNFLKETFRSPKSTGAVAESSKGLAKLVTDEADLGAARCIVELGPGTGVFSKEILNKKNKTSVFFAIELNEAFVKIINRHLPHCTVYNDTCENIDKYLRLNNFDKADRIVSGLPWTAFEKELQKRLISKIQKSMVKEGIFVTFSYFPLTYLPAGRRFRRLLLETFKTVKTTKIVWLNLPPAFAYVCSN